MRNQRQNTRRFLPGVILRAACAAVLGGIAAGAWLPATERAWAEETASNSERNMVYELRTYTTVPGRLPALHARFKNHTMRLFEKHGMKNVIYWIPNDKPDTLIYVLAHASQEAARQSFAAFREDPDWKRARDESEKEGPIVLKVESQFLTPTEYSPLPTLP